MKTVGIICEYNPFHQGHAYHMQEIRRKYGEETAVVCVLSGDFVQRGEPAVFSKYIRASAAVTCGADLVLEMPLPWCLGSAEIFARGGVGLLQATGVVGTVSFGSESADLATLHGLAAALQDEKIQQRVFAILKEDGVSYAVARQKAIAEVLPKTAAALLKNPNDILAVEYIKAAESLNYNVDYLPVMRLGSSHDGMGSAAEIRGQWQENIMNFDRIPDAAAAIYQREISIGRGPVFGRDLNIALLSRLRERTEEEWAAIPDAAEGLEHRLYDAAQRENSLEEIAFAAKSKRYALSRLRRMTMFAALNIPAGLSAGTPPYIRPLAMNKRGRSLLHEMRTKATIPILMKSSQLHKAGERAEKVFSVTAKAHDVYVLGYDDSAFWRGGEDQRFTIKAVAGENEK